LLAILARLQHAQAPEGQHVVGVRLVAFAHNNVAKLIALLVHQAAHLLIVLVRQKSEGRRSSHHFLVDRAHAVWVRGSSQRICWALRSAKACPRMRSSIRRRMSGSSSVASVFP